MMMVEPSAAATAARARLHPYVLQPSTETCRTTTDCIGDAPFCRNGSVCLRGLCWTLPGVPCQAPDWCDERAHRCQPRACQSWRDCDDGLYCTGDERCVQGRCVLWPGSDCRSTGHYCDEAVRRCTRVPALGRALARMAAAHAALPALHAWDSNSSNSSNSSNTTQPIGSISNEALAGILSAIGLLVFVVLFFALIAWASRRQLPTILIDSDRSAQRAGQVYLPEAYY